MFEYIYISKNEREKNNVCQNVILYVLQLENYVFPVRRAPRVLWHTAYRVVVYRVRGRACEKLLRVLLTIRDVKRG